MLGLPGTLFIGQSKNVLPLYTKSIMSVAVPSPRFGWNDNVFFLSTTRVLIVIGASYQI